MASSILQFYIIVKFILFSLQSFSIVDAESTSVKNEILSNDLLDHKQLIEVANNDVIINELDSKKSVSDGQEDDFENSAWFLNVPLLPTIIATSNSIPAGPCKRQLQLYLKHLRNGTLWATQMFDSSAKYPYGLFDGLTRHLGSFDQCMQIQTNIENNESGKIEEIRSRYCLVDVSYKEANESSTFNKRLDIFFDPQHSAWESIREKGDYRRYRRYLLQMALCFPAECQSDDIVSALNKTLQKFGTQNNLQIEVAIPPNFCSPDPAKETWKFSIQDKIFLIFCCLLITLIIISSIIETNSSQKEKMSFTSEIFSCFSARRCFNQIFRITYRHRGLDSVYFVRVLLTFLTVFGHRHLLFMSGGNITGKHLEWALSTPYFILVRNGAILIEAFFGIGGLLVSYHVLGFLDITKKNNFLLLIFKRFLRLTPLFMFITFLYATVFQHLGSGPFWESQIGVIRDSCTSYWWSNLFYINNYFGSKNKCIFQSWYLAVDFQCYIIGLLLIIAFHKMPRKFGYTFLSCSLILSMAISFYVTFANNISPIAQSLTIIRRVEESEFFLNYYVKTHVRISAYIVGLIVGAIIYDYKNVSWRISKVWMKIVCISLFLLLFFGIPLIGDFFMNPNVQTSALQKALFSSLHRTLFSFSVCFVPLFFTICDGLDFYYNLMTARWFQPVSKLTYAIYLIHFLIQQYELGTTRTPLTFSMYNSLKMWTGDLVFSLCLALFLVTVIEISFTNLGNLLLRAKKNSQMTPNSLKKGN